MGIIANKIITGNQVVFEKPEVPKPIKEPSSTGSKISANKIIIGAAIAYEKPVEQPKVVEKPPHKIGSKIFAGKIVTKTEQAPVDTRLSSYFLIQKESDYLNHNIRNNRR